MIQLRNESRLPLHAPMVTTVIIAFFILELQGGDQFVGQLFRQT
jgi:hypothetical protein